VGDDGDSFDFHRPNSHMTAGGRPTRRLVGLRPGSRPLSVQPHAEPVKRPLDCVRDRNCATALGGVEPVHLPPEIDQIKLPGLVLPE